MTDEAGGRGKPGALFDWSDPLRLDDQLGEEERHIRDAARDYAQSRLMPRVLTAFREERFDREILHEMGALGFLGATLPPEHGGAGASYVELWTSRPRDRARRFGIPLGDERAVVARHVSDLRLWQRGAAATNICRSSRPASGSAVSA